MYANKMNDSLKKISDLFGDEYMKRFTLLPPSTVMFPPSKSDIVNALLLKKCPLCSCNLYQTRNKKLWRCKSVRKDGFIIKDETLSKYR